MIQIEEVMEGITQTKIIITQTILTEEIRTIIIAGITQMIQIERFK